MADNQTRDPIPEFETLDEIAEFWDTHSTGDYEDVTHEVQFEVKLRRESQPVKILPELSETIRALARARGVSPETLINVWLTEKALELA
jgi:hypothetical protein